MTEEREREFMEEAEEDDEPTVLLDEAEEFGRTADESIPRVGQAHYWKRNSKVPALLTTSHQGQLNIIGLGSVEGGSRTRARGARNLEVRVRYIFNSSMPLTDAAALLSARERALLNSMVGGPLRPLSPRLGSNLRGALVQQDGSLAGALARLQNEMNEELADRALSRQPRVAVPVREALSSALHFFGAAWHVLKPVAQPQPSEFALTLEAATRSVENDYIADDSVAFEGWERSTYSNAGWWEFHNKGRRLLVKNINVSPQESRTGADLVYVRRDPDAFVLVQYKVMGTLQDGRMIYRPDTRLDGQIGRMMGLESRSAGDAVPDSASNYRLGQGFSFVKFVAPAAPGTERPGELLPGFYFPSDFLRRLLREPDVGPQGGTVYFLEKHRSITPGTFAQLVRDSWVGSVGDATELLREIFDLSNDPGSIVLAVDEPID